MSGRVWNGLQTMAKPQGKAHTDPAPAAPGPDVPPPTEETRLVQSSPFAVADVQKVQKYLQHAGGLSLLDLMRQQHELLDEQRNQIRAIERELGTALEGADAGIEPPPSTLGALQRHNRALILSNTQRIENILRTLL